MRFEDSEPIECASCGDLVYAGETALTYNGNYYCCEDCVKDAIYEEHKGEVGEHYIMTGADWEAEWGDQKYHEMKDEGLI